MNKFLVLILTITLWGTIIFWCTMVFVVIVGLSQGRTMKSFQSLDLWLLIIGLPVFASIVQVLIKKLKDDN